MNETWSTIGWAKSSDDGSYIWCYEHEAEFVIGKNINYGSGLANWIAPIARVGSASRTRGWKYDSPDFIRLQEGPRTNEHVGRRVRILEGELKFD
jgi:hypothetical protein